MYIYENERKFILNTETSLKVKGIIFLFETVPRNYFIIACKIIIKVLVINVPSRDFYLHIVVLLQLVKMADRVDRRNRLKDSEGSRSGTDEPPNSRLFIVCSKQLTEDDFRSSFSRFGEIEEIWVVKDRSTGDRKGKFTLCKYFYALLRF